MAHDLLETPLSAREAVSLLNVLVLEIIAALEPDTKKAEEALQDVGSAILTTANGMAQGRHAQLLRALADMLIGTEDSGLVPAQDGE